MSRRQLPAVALGATGLALLGALAVAWPSASEGGPAVAYAVAVVLVLGLGGTLAVAVALYSVRSDRTRLSMVVPAGYAAVGAVYGVVRLRLFTGVSAVGFTVAAACFVALVVGGTVKLTRSTSSAGSRVGGDDA